ncbi:MAG: hypothetical protein A2463_00550 [Candidatus Staskawiczbacteria bacterium RIFOXYC2_FULL_32_10]|nr:MAG: hypothetical protein A2463_00550 [Candidatus Staskawiczbacteria bacterium RIFOXYC2_FULL_32_10]
MHFARNTASKIAEGEILYFTDDDMKADGGLLEEIIKVFDKEKDIGAVTGLILPIFEVNPPKWILENCYNSILSLTEPTREKKEIISYESMGVFSCHYAILKNVFVRAGGFNPENTAGLWIGNGELGLNIKIKKLKLKFVFLPKSIIYHIIPKERLIQKYINKRLANQGAVDSYTAYQAKKYNNFQLYVKILYYILRMPYCLLFLLINFITGNSKWRIRWAFIFYYIRRIKYDFKLIINSDWKKLVLKENWLD